MIKGFEDRNNITIQNVIDMFGIFNKRRKIVKIDSLYRVLCTCDQCGNDFSREWRSLKKSINKNLYLCWSCIQTNRFKNPKERERQSNVLKKHYKNPKNKEKLSNALIGAFKEHPESKIKMSISAKKRFEDPKEREKTSRAVNKRFEDPKEREKISIGQKNRYKNPEARKKNSDAIKLLWETNEEYRKKHSRSLKKYFSNPESRKKSSDIHKKLWKNKDYRNKMLPIVSRNRMIFDSSNSKEKILFNIVKDFEFCFSGCGEVQVANFFPDFVNINKKLIIELNGCYWHKCRKCFPNRFKGDNFLNRDLGKLHAYSREGYKTLFVWEHELDNLEVLNNRIIDFMNNPNYVTKIRQD